MMTLPYNVGWEEEMVINFILLQRIFKSFVVKGIGAILDISRVQDLNKRY